MIQVQRYRLSVRFISFKLAESFMISTFRTQISKQNTPNIPKGEHLHPDTHTGQLLLKSSESIERENATVKA